MELKDYIDSTILKTEATKEDIEKLCAEAKSMVLNLFVSILAMHH